MPKVPRRAALSNDEYLTAAKHVLRLHPPDATYGCGTMAALHRSSNGSITLCPICSAFEARRKAAIERRSKALDLLHDLWP